MPITLLYARNIAIQQSDVDANRATILRDMNEAETINVNVMGVAIKRARPPGNASVRGLGSTASSLLARREILRQEYGQMWPS